MVLKKSEWFIYPIIFVSGLLYQPGWFISNFGFSARFWEHVPFKVYWGEVEFIYAVLWTLLVYSSVKFAKRYL